jgi:hypothetical protein
LSGLSGADRDEEPESELAIGGLWIPGSPPSKSAIADFDLEVPISDNPKPVALPNDGFT